MKNLNQTTALKTIKQLALEIRDFALASAFALTCYFITINTDIRPLLYQIF